MDLAPTDKADPSGVYSAALTEATSNPRVMNIALTGPYGSGKSSNIKSFLKGYKRPVLQISLAAFLPEAVPVEGRATKQEIERSILQQMIYVTDARRLPLSRFKRIRAPGKWSFLITIYITLGLLASWYLVHNRDEVATGAYFIPLSLINWLNLTVVGVGATFFWLAIHHLYSSSFGISLKSISLKDIEITPEAATEESILNRHLDEIIYFFQATNYELVIIEDLDRFDNPEIFVTLREINGLVNANRGVKRPIRFLYALRDGMFSNTDRTKFFEFIIPVIPIVNSSNSIDKVLEQGKRLSLEAKLNTQFLREVSRYLDDLRLIQNIFNEFAIYIANLEAEDDGTLDANKLLAILIYKNSFPRDFEDLHHGKGILAGILRCHNEYITRSEDRCLGEISRLEELIALGERQLPNDLSELRRIYAMALIELVPDNYTHLKTESSAFIPISQLSTHERFEEFLSAVDIYVRDSNGHQHRLSKPEVQAKINTSKTFQQRKDDVERKSATFRESTLGTIREVRSKLANRRMIKFNEIVREHSDELGELFAAFGDGAELARFLVLEGFLDDTYYQYTSLFHSGRLSPSDNKFLIRIRGFDNPDADFQIDNPNEVIAAMRDEDFSRSYVLNGKIVDCLLADPTSYARQTKRLLDFIASHFDECEPFFATYYARGVAVPTLITSLVRIWPGFIERAITSPANLSHVARIVSHLPTRDLELLARENRALTKFVSESLPNILAEGIDVVPERLKLLRVETVDLSAMANHSALMQFLFEWGLYKLSVDNLNFIFHEILDFDWGKKLGEQNYTMLLAAGSKPLLSKIDRSFETYLRDVLLCLPENRFESVSAIELIIGRRDVQLDSVINFLKMQTALLPHLDRVPKQLQSTIFQIERIEPSWENCLSFLGSENYDAEVLTEFLNRSTTVEKLTLNLVPNGEDALPLRNFLFGNDSLDDEAYEKYVMCLPYTFKEFPEPISPEKRMILVERKRVSFSETNLATLADDISASALFAANNFNEFLAAQSGSKINDDFFEQLLNQDITDEERIRALSLMDLSLLDGMPARAALVGRILARAGVVSDNLGFEAARGIIISSDRIEEQITLFNMLHERFDDQQVREILQLLPKPLPDIKPGWATPKIENSDVNLKFVTWLKARGFISSWTQGGLFDDDIRINLFRK